VRGKAKLGEGKGAKLGEGCPKVRLSQDRLPNRADLGGALWKYEMLIYPDPGGGQGKSTYTFSGQIAIVDENVLALHLKFETAKVGVKVGS